MTKFASRVFPLKVRRCGRAWVVGIFPTYGHSALRLVAALRQLAHRLSPSLVFGTKDLLKHDALQNSGV